MADILDEIIEGVINGENDRVQELVLEAIAGGAIHPADLLNQGMIPAMAEVGRLFEEGEFFVPDMLVSARAMQAGLKVLKPHLGQSDVNSNGKIVIGTVRGDIHDIGKNLVAMMLEGAGFEIHDLGTDVAPEKFVAAVTEINPDLVALSALLTTTMMNMKITVEALRAAGLRDRVKVMVGGAPISENFAQLIGADGFAPDASRAVALAKNMLQV
jgi:5-methyltetrahydrofolate--homocysteine methyltransferase